MTALLARLTKPSVTNEPPSAQDLVRTEIAVVVVVLFALFLGIGIRNNAVNNHRSVRLGEGLPSIAVPNGWITGQPEGTLLHARSPRTRSSFNTEMTVTARELTGEATLATVRTGLGLQRTQELLHYRELEAQAVTVNGRPGILVTYAYVADPTRDQGALAPPVVVEAQDLIFTVDNNALIVTVAADATLWEAESTYVGLIHRSLNVRQVQAQEVQGGRE